jgi:hypothetical protein
MPRYSDPSDGSWDSDDRFDRDRSREPIVALKNYCREDDLERAVLAAGLTTASLDDLDGEDGLDEFAWNRAMEQACEQDGAR